jgi:hypothetical protein
MNTLNLWLDDLRDPVKHQAPQGAVWVKTARQAINLIRQGDVAYISFDHDLGGSKTGYDVATEIEKLCYQGKIACPKWEIHSANPVGWTNINAAMRSAEKYAGLNPLVLVKGQEVTLEGMAARLGVTAKEQLAIELGEKVRQGKLGFKIQVVIPSGELMGEYASLNDVPNQLKTSSGHTVDVNPAWLRVVYVGK